MMMRYNKRFLRVVYGFVLKRDEVYDRAKLYLDNISDYGDRDDIVIVFSRKIIKASGLKKHGVLGMLLVYPDGERDQGTKVCFPLAENTMDWRMCLPPDEAVVKLKEYLGLGDDVQPSWHVPYY